MIRKRKKNYKCLNLCGLSTESFLAIWPSQYKCLINEFLTKKCVFALSTTSLQIHHSPPQSFQRRKKEKNKFSFVGKIAVTSTEESADAQCDRVDTNLFVEIILLPRIDRIEDLSPVHPTLFLRFSKMFLKISIYNCNRLDSQSDYSFIPNNQYVSLYKNNE